MRLGGIWLLGKLDPRILVTMSLATYGIGYVFMAPAQGAVAMAVGGAFFGIGNSVMFPVVAAWVGREVEETRRAAAQAVNNASFYFGMYALPWPQAWLIGIWGYAAVEWMWAGVATALTVTMAAVILGAKK